MLDALGFLAVAVHVDPIVSSDILLGKCDQRLTSSSAGRSGLTKLAWTYGSTRDWAHAPYAF